MAAVLIQPDHPANPRKHDWSDIASVPRDGTLVVVHDEDAGAFPMRWTPGATNVLLLEQGDGLWVADGGGFTWSEAEGFGPTGWSTVEAYDAFRKRTSN